MSPFFRKKHIVTQETLGERLRKVRQGKMWTLEVASRKTNISKRYLEALEKTHYDSIPGEVYIINFIRLYSKHLGINPEGTLQQYHIERHIIEQRKYPHFLKELGHPAFIDTILKPRAVRSLIICAIIALMISYIAYQIYATIAPPPLLIYYPKNNIEIASTAIRVVGETVVEARVSINSEAVLLNDNGTFVTTVPLREGLNIIVIKAKKRHGMGKKEVRHVLVEPTQTALK